MIDNFSIGLTHLLMLLCAWRLLFRPDLDSEVGTNREAQQQGWKKPKAKPEPRDA
jgi:hypothetical protein